MEPIRYLYRKKAVTAERDADADGFLSACEIQTMCPTPLHLKFRGERITLRQRLVRMYFWLITAGKCKIYMLRYGDDVVHTSFVVPRCGKFPFLKKGDYEIGPCVTSSEYRRRGAYFYVLGHITAQPEYEGASFYMIVKSTNAPSVAGIEKAGFTRCGTVRQTPVLKKYVQEKQQW